MKRFTKSVAAFAVISCASIISSGSVSASSTAITTSSDWMAVNPATGDTYLEGQVDIWAPPPLDPRTRLLAPDDWTQCWVLGNQSWVISSFAGSWGTIKKNLALKCGSASTMGYLHILEGHQSDWRNRISLTGTSSSTDSWDDFMWWAAEQTWKNPQETVFQGNGKICRFAPMEMFGPNSSGQMIYKYTFVPTYIWSMTNNLLITAYPPKNKSC